MVIRLEQCCEQGVALDALFRMDAESTPFAVITGSDLLGADRRPPGDVEA